MSIPRPVAPAPPTPPPVVSFDPFSDRLVIAVRTLDPHMAGRIVRWSVETPDGKRITEGDTTLNQDASGEVHVAASTAARYMRAGSRYQLRLTYEPTGEQWVKPFAMAEVRQ